MLGKIRNLQQVPCASDSLSHVLVAMALLMLIACDSQSRPAPRDRITLDGTELYVPLPQSLRSISAVDPAAVQAVVTINGVQTVLQQNAGQSDTGQAGGRFSGQVTVPAQANFMVRIDFLEMFNGETLPLARAEQIVNTSRENATLTLMNDDYDFSAFDSDGDGVNNMLERQFNTSPLDAAQFPELVEVEVFASLPVQATTEGFDNYNVIVSIGNVSRSSAATEGPFNQVLTVVRQDILTVEARLVESTTGEFLTFGTQVQEVASPDAFNSVNFSADEYNLEADQDGDGSTDLNELIAGTDLFGGSAANQINYSLIFDVPPQIANPEPTFAVLRVNGNNVTLTRTDNTYTGLASVAAGTAIEIEAEISDTFDGSPLLLATFSGQAVPTEGETLLLQGFSLQIDNDNDGVVNYIELAEGSDPFNPPAPECTTIVENVTATLTDDAFVQPNNRLFNNDTLQVWEGRRTTLMRYVFDETLGTVNSANLNMTVTTDEGNGLLSVHAVPDFDWSDASTSLVLPELGAAIGGATNDWLTGVEYTFELDPAAIVSDFTLFVVHTGINDVAFGSSAVAEAPSLELTVERCQ